MTRVLIVEDEESFADPLAFLLSKEGFTTAVAATGQQALDEFDLFAYRIIAPNLAFHRFR